MRAGMAAQPQAITSTKSAASRGLAPLPRSPGPSESPNHTSAAVKSPDAAVPTIAQYNRTLTDRHSKLVMYQPAVAGKANSTIKIRTSISMLQQSR